MRILRKYTVVSKLESGRHLCECYMDMEDSDPEQMQKPKLENNVKM